MLSSASLGCKMIQRLRSDQPQQPSGNSVPETRSSPSSGLTDSDSAVTAGADPRQELINSSKKFLDLPYFSADLDGEGTGAVNAKVQYQAPDRYRITTSLPSGNSSVEMVMIGKDTYMRIGSKWQTMPGAGAGSQMRSMIDVFNEKNFELLKEVKYVGEDSVNGTTAYKYTYDSNLPTGGSPFTSTVWIGKSSGLPMKIYVEYRSGSLKNVTVNYDTDTGVSIEKPE